MMNMEILRYKISLQAYFNTPIAYDPDPIYVKNLDELDYESISKDQIRYLDGQYDWIDAWRDSDYDREIGGFNNEDVLMEVAYEKGNYIITLLSDKPFDTIVRSNCYYTNNPNDFKNVTLKEAVMNFIEGCISDGIGENEIGHITYQCMKCDIWMGELKEIID
jgi:hypothetical protein